jgi:membrane protein DedA with SNARE-associated domain
VVLFNLLSKFFARYGYAAVFLGVMLENAGLPLPGESVLLFGSFLAHQGALSLWWVIANAFAGGTAGGSLGYFIGRLGGPDMVRRMRSHAYFSGPRFDRAEETFQKHGAWAVFVGRFVVGLRIIVGFLAGALKMRFIQFFLLNAAGALVWAATMGTVGYAIGSSWQRIVRIVRGANWTVLILVVAISIVLLLRSRLRARKRERQKPLN